MNFSFLFKQNMMQYIKSTTFAASTCEIRIYKGSIPTDAAEWAANYVAIGNSYMSSDWLLQYTGLTFNYVATPPSWKLSAIKAANGLNTGIPSYAIVGVGGPITQAMVGTNGIIMCGVSLASGDEPVYLNSMSVTAGQSITLQDFGITAS